MIFLATACVFILSLQNNVQCVQLKLLDQTFNNISDDKLMVQPETYIRDYGSTPGKDKRRRVPYYYFPPSEKQLKVKILDMMRQQVYDTQERMRRLSPFLAKHKSDPALRMAYIMNRLNQLIIDIRRIYTQALRWRKNKKRVYEHILWYTHIIKKYMDVLYIVEFTIKSHNEYMNSFPNIKLK